MNASPGRADVPSLPQLGQAAAQVAQALGDALLVLDEGEADEAFAAGAEADTGRQGDFASPPDVRADLDRVHVLVRPGDRGPDDHRALGLGDVPADPSQSVDQRVAAAL